MPTKDDTKAPATVGRTYRGEASPPITTAEAAASLQEKRKSFSEKPGAKSLQVYFVEKGIDNPILQASMAAYTDVRMATVEDFDAIFDDHHTTSEKKAAAEKAAADKTENPS